MTTESIEPRIDYRKVAPEAIRALAAVERYARGSNLEPALLELVRLRASIINGCAYCVDMHSKDARAHGESEQRLLRRERLAGSAIFHAARAGGVGLDRSG